MANERSYEIGKARLELGCGDITRERVDAIVNAANATLAGGGGVDGAIHRAAGPELLQACFAARARLPGQRLATGSAIATPGFRLAAKHVIHCVGPIYDEAPGKAPALLASCFGGALSICRELGASSVAFPAISTGVYGYPIPDAARVSLAAIAVDLARHGVPGVVRMVLFDEATYRAFGDVADDLARTGQLRVR